jgi:hypothetical protein
MTKKSKLYESIIILFLGSIIALSLSKSENNFLDIRSIVSHDQINHFKLAQSSETQILDLRLPIRTAENIDDSLGNPYHQFYSPAAHFFMAIFSIIFVDMIFGTSILFVLMMSLGFFYSFRLYKYLTKSNIYGIVGAFLFIYCPYLATVRVTHGGITEYFAFCLSPAVLYYLVLSLAGKRFINILLCILWLSILILVHLLTAFYLMFFVSVFFIAYFINVVIKCKINRLNFFNRHLHVFFKRLAIFILANIGALAVTSFFIFPIILSDNLFIKYFPYSENIKLTGSCTNLYSLFSITPSLNILQIESCRGAYQVGFILFIGFISSIAIFWKNKKSFLIFPLIFTALFILFVIINPAFMTYFPYLNLAQFAFRFLIEFQIFDSLLFVLGMKELCDNFKISFINKIAFSIIVIISSLLMVRPYLDAMNIQSGFPKLMNSNDIKNSDFFFNAIYNYYLIQKDISKFSSLDKQFIVSPAATSNSQYKKFIINLAELAQNSDYQGNIIFYVLYYPSLMKITAKLNNTSFAPEADVFWFKTAELSEHRQFRYVGVHALQLKNLPSQGILEVDTEFTGSALGNKISLTAIFLLAGLSLVKLIRRCRRAAGQRPAPKGAELSPEPEKLL